MKTSKVKSVSVSGTWEKDGKTYYRHDYEFEDGQKLQANHTKELPIAVGTEVEYEVKRTHEKYGDSGSVKKPNDFKRGGYKKPVNSLSQIKRMVSSNAVHAVVTVNAAYEEERLKGTALAKIEKFTLGDITGDIEKWSEEDDNLTSRLASMNNAAIMAKYKSFKTVDDLLTEAQNLYKYITR